MKKSKSIILVCVSLGLVGCGSPPAPPNSPLMDPSAPNQLAERDESQGTSTDTSTYTNTSTSSTPYRSPTSPSRSTPWYGSSHTPVYHGGSYGSSSPSTSAPHVSAPSVSRGGFGSSAHASGGGE